MIQLLLVASIWYLFATSILTVGQYYVERYYGRGSARTQPETPIQLLKRTLFSTNRQPPDWPARAVAVQHRRRRHAMTTGPMVRSEGVHKHFGHNQVLKGIDLEVQAGQVFCIVGPSGSGKSTFLRCINHLEKIDGGRLSVDGQLVGYREAGDKLHELRAKRGRRERARTSAWCSSGSTCSRTRPRCRTSSRRRSASAGSARPRPPPTR